MPLLPRWYLQSQFIQHSKRLPKRTKFRPPLTQRHAHVAPTYPRYTGDMGYIPSHCVLPAQASAEHLVVDALANYHNRHHRYKHSAHREYFIPDGNLSNEEYRFWAGDRIAAARPAKCRGCWCTVWSPEDRRKHMDEVGCTKRLVIAYNFLLRDRKCIICDTHTGGRQWGVPICSKKCQELWMFMLQRPSPLLEALRLTDDILRTR